MFSAQPIIGLPERPTLLPERAECQRRLLRVNEAAMLQRRPRLRQQSAMLWRILRQWRLQARLSHFQCDQIWRNFSVLAQISKSLAIFQMLFLVFGNILNLFWQKIAIGQSFTVVNIQISKKIYPSGHTGHFALVNLKLLSLCCIK